MEKRKAGLHKKVSSIFDGVTVPKSNGPKPCESPDIKGESPNQDAIDQQKRGFMSKLSPQLSRSSGADKFGGRIVEKNLSAIAGRGATKFGKYKPAKTNVSVNDKNSKTKIALILILFIVFVFIMMSNLNSGSKKSTPTPKNKQTIELVAKKNPEAEVNWEIPKLYPGQLRDPMVPTQVKEIINKEWIEKKNMKGFENWEAAVMQIPHYHDIIIQSIFYSENGRSAVVANEIVYEGDKIFEVTVVKIEKGSVEFEKDGLKFSKPLGR